MKFKWLTLMLAALLALPAVAAPPSKRANHRASASIITDKYINANKILMYINNEANFAYDAAQEFGKYDGFYYPYSNVDDILTGANDKTCIYDAGIWMGAIDSNTNDTLLAVAEYSTEYVPGSYGGTPGDPAFRIYKLYSDSMQDSSDACPTCRRNADYLNWPISQGAPWHLDTLIDTLYDTLPGPVYDTTVDTTIDTVPSLIGDQMAWMVFNDGDAAQHSNDAGSTLPLGVEVQQSSFAFNREDAMGNIVFIKYKIINKGGRYLRNMFVSLWADPDLGGASDDLVGCDSTLSLGFCYNATNNDSKYGSTPPAVGFDFFQGPLYFTDSLKDTARMWDTIWPRYRNLPMSSFNKYINGTDPSSKVHTYNYMQGLNRDGSVYAYKGNPVKFFNSGNPVTNEGDLDSDPADRRYMLTTGPFTLQAGDSTEVLAAVVAGTACDRLTAIDALKYYDRFAQTAYELNFDLPAPPRAPAVHVAQDDELIGLSWTNLSEADHVDYPFEGYTVLQGSSSSGPWKRIPNATFDLSNGIGVIYDEEFDVANCGVLNKPAKFGSDVGVQRWFTPNADYINGGPLYNATEYFFRVEAYSYDPTQTPKTLTGATIVKVVPQKHIPEKTLPLRLDNIIATTHTGISDGSVVPQIVDPDSLTGHTYKVWFYDSAGTVYWTLYDVDSGVTVLTTQANQGATTDLRQDFTKVDGMIVHVYGPPPGYKGGEPGDADEGWNVPSGARRWTQAGADGLHFEGFRGAAGWASGPDAFFAGQGVGADRMRNLEFRLAATDSVGHFVVTDSNVSYGYRYMRRAVDPPQQPSFGPYIINATGGYAYQIFEQNVPLSVWDIDANPPRRLAVGFMENNVPGGTVDGRYWPPYNGWFDNTASTGPREWLFVFDTAYSTTADPTMQVDFLNVAYTPFLLHATWNSRYDSTDARSHWTPGDRFIMWANHINYVNDTFTFVAAKPTLVSSGSAVMDKVGVAPNPYYLFASYDRGVFNRRMQFVNLPAECTVSIYTLTGDRIRVLHKNDASTSLLDWDILTENRIPLASGIYIYVVDAPGFGQKIGKMAIFTEQEQLDTY
ncbi:MAG: hypothetical protein HY851_06415 [candidate division Zixibacteria bacterium]|nr:hypothetical protein [candidate division Zixibacteria bacterium]